MSPNLKLAIIPPIPKSFNSNILRFTVSGDPNITACSKVFLGSSTACLIELFSSCVFKLFLAPEICYCIFTKEFLAIDSAFSSESDTTIFLHIQELSIAELIYSESKLFCFIIFLYSFK